MDQATPTAAIEIPVTTTETHRKKTPMALGVITAGVLADLHLVPRRDTRKKTGYQREVSPTRVNRLVRDLSENRVDLPTAVLLNLRTYKPGIHLVPRDGREFFCPNAEKLHVVDGQHRVVALTRLVQMDSDRWSDYQIPFVCMLGADEREEMEQFYVVNSTAKSVRTDLALDLLKQRAESDPDVKESLIERSEFWKVKAQTLVEELSVTPIWRNRIRLPGDPKGDATITSSGMVASLRQLLGTPYFGSITTENQLRVLDGYWQGLREVISGAFDEPSQYVLQKATGVMVMHGLLVSLIEYVRSKGQSVIEPESYAEPLKGVLVELEGDTATGDIARGADFWRVGPDGAAGSFSSNAGRRVLLAKMRALLPPLDVE
jgi:DGQHR domain-containing protein